MRVLVCGGAGYIGAHMGELFAAAGHEAVVFDNLEGGHSEHVAGTPPRRRRPARCAGDRRALAAVRFDAVMHLAGKIVVSESVRDPSTYYEHNVAGTLNLLRAACGTAYRR